MNTISNFTSNQQLAVSKKNQINNNNNVNFKGFSINARAILRSRAKNEIISGNCEDIACQLGVNPMIIFDLTRNASAKRIRFLELLSSRYSAKNDGLTKNLKEDPQHVYDIFNSNKKITNIHKKVAKYVHGSTKNLSRIFKSANNDESRLNFALNINKICDGVPKAERRMEIIPELLESPNSKEYINNFDKYKSYITLNQSDKDAVKNLDSLVQSGKYDAKKYNLEFINKEILTKKLPQTSVLNSENLEKNYTPEGFEFLNTFAQRFRPAKEGLEAGRDLDIMSMYKSADKSNIEVRKEILDIFKSNNDRPTQIKDNEITSLRELFDITDKDKHAGSVVLKISNSGVHFYNPSEYLELLQNVEPKKLDIFTDNAVRIIDKTKDMGKNKNDKYLKTLNKEIENPFFVTKDAFGVEDSILSKMTRYVKNKMNQIRYRKEVKNEQKAAQALPAMTASAENKVNETIKEVKEAESAKAVRTAKAIDEPIPEEFMSEIRLLKEGEELPLVVEREELIAAREAAKAMADAESSKLPRTLEDLKSLAKNDSTLEVIEGNKTSNNVIFRQKDPETGRAEVDYIFNNEIKPLASKKYVYDEEGNVAREIMHDANNNFAGTYDFQYDELKRPVQEVFTEPNGLIRSAEEYMYAGNGKKPVSTASAQFDYAFDEDEVLIGKRTIEFVDDKKKRMLEETIDGMTEITYDNKGNAIRQVIADTEGKVLEVYEAEPMMMAASAETPAAVETTEAIIANNQAADAKPAKRVLNRTVPKAPNAKKLAVINDVNEIIEKKLGSKTLSEQKHDYAVGATRMRLQILPEIFESIKETRQAERAAGKTKMSVANKDAVELYGKINGRNKKLVNYMLKKLNSDGTRMFSIKDIINTIDSAEKEIRVNKAADKAYKAADAKDLYNNLLNTQIEQYGKLQRNKKK